MALPLRRLRYGRALHDDARLPRRAAVDHPIRHLRAACLGDASGGDRLRRAGRRLRDPRRRDDHRLDHLHLLARGPAGPARASD